MNDSKPGRKSDFEPGDNPARINVLLPRETLAKLAAFITLRGISRNHVINDAILRYMEAEEKTEKNESSDNLTN